jgi:hypothetical protein
MKITKEKSKYYITNEKRLCKRGCVLEDLSIKDLEKIEALIEETLSHKRFDEVRKGKRLIVGNIKIGI